MNLEKISSYISELEQVSHTELYENKLILLFATKQQTLDDYILLKDLKDNNQISTSEYCNRCFRLAAIGMDLQRASEDKTTVMFPTLVKCLRSKEAKKNYITGKKGGTDKEENGKGNQLSAVIREVTKTAFGCNVAHSEYLQKMIGFNDEVSRRSWFSALSEDIREANISDEIRALFWATLLLEQGENKMLGIVDGLFDPDRQVFPIAGKETNFWQKKTEVIEFAKGYVDGLQVKIAKKSKKLFRKEAQLALTIFEILLNINGNSIRVEGLTVGKIRKEILELLQQKKVTEAQESLKNTMIHSSEVFLEKHRLKFGVINDMLKIKERRVRDWWEN